MTRRYSAAPRGATVEARFWAKVDRSGGPDACWPWTAGCHDAGYGVFWDGARFWKAHRFAWMLAHGSITDGLKRLHSCDNPPCVNTAHLFLGTQADNMRDMMAKGRERHPVEAVRGAANGHAHLTWVDITAIRERGATGEPQRSIGRAYGVDHGTIGFILRGVSWREEWRPT